MDILEVSMIHHVGIVLVVIWVLSTLNYCYSFVYLVALFYLYQVHEHYMLRLKKRLQHEERRQANQKRMLSDSETVRWLNGAVEKMWPICMERIASQQIILPIIPWFLEKYKPWTAKEALVESLYLGRSPPMFTEMRVLGESSGDDHLVMELGMNFLAADDMSAIIAVKLRKRLGFGMWAKLHMTGMHVEGKVIVGVKFLREYPFLGRLRVCFVEPPYFQLTVKPLFNHGIDVTEIPGIAGWIDNLLAVAFEQTLVEPNMLVVDVEKFVSAPKERWFSVDEKEPVAVAIVEIIEGEDMKPSDLNGFSDPYVKGQVGTFKFRTKVQKKTLSPKWHEEFKIPICTWETLNLLTLEVCDKDHLFDDTLGKCSININELRGQSRRAFWLPLQNIKMGRLHLAVTVLDPEGKVEEQCDIRDAEQMNEKENKNSILRETSQKKGSFSTVSSEQVPKVADDFEPINVEGQKQTGIWVHHPGSDVSQTRETRKGKPRHSGIKIQRESNSSFTKNNSQSATPASNYSGESSSSDESQKVHKRKPLAAIQTGLKKVGSMFHRSPRSPKSPRSPRMGDPNVTEETKSNDDISGPLDGTNADKEITSPPEAASPRQSSKRGMAKSIAQKVEKSAHNLKKAVTRKVSNKSKEEPTTAENSQEVSSCSEESRSSSAVEETPRSDSLVDSLPLSFQVEKFPDTTEQNSNHPSTEATLQSAPEPRVSEVTFPGFAEADKAYSSMNSDAYRDNEVDKTMNSELPYTSGENEAEKSLNTKYPETGNYMSETDKAKTEQPMN